MNYLFDLFGTLIDADMECYRLMMTESFGLALSEYGKVIELVDNTDFSSEDVALRDIFENFRVEESSERKKLFLGKMENWKKDLSLRNGDIDVLWQLRESGSSIGLLSNTNVFVEDVVEASGVERYMDFMVLSHKVGMSKPDRRIYELALSLGKNKPEEVTMIGDQIEKDVLAPMKLGMDAILYDPRGINSEYHGNKIKDFKELL